MVKKQNNEIKKLYRSKEDKMIAGVCGGVADYFQIDPVWVRLVAVLLIFADGIGIIMYLLAWILIPENPDQSSTKKTKFEEAWGNIKNHKYSRNKTEKTCCFRNNKNIFLGVILVIIGVIALLNSTHWIDSKFIWPSLIILLGIFLLARRSR